MSKLAGKTAIVTGAGRGIGRACALKLAGEGAALVLNDLDEAALAETQAAVSAKGGRAALLPGPVDAPDFGETIVALAMARYGHLDIVVNNAGYTWDAVVQSMTDEMFQAMLDVHLVAPFRILRAALIPWREAAKAEAAEGREVFRKVVNVTSISGTGGNPGQANYAAGKAGLVGLTKTLAKEWGRYKICVNAVAFGSIDTRLTAAKETGQAIEVAGRRVALGVPQAQRDLTPMFIPMGRPGTPDEAAGAIYLFCIPESDYVTGQTLVCGGGLGQLA